LALLVLIPDPAVAMPWPPILDRALVRLDEAQQANDRTRFAMELQQSLKKPLRLIDQRLGIAMQLQPDLIDLKKTYEGLLVSWLAIATDDALRRGSESDWFTLRRFYGETRSLLRVHLPEVARQLKRLIKISSVADADLLNRVGDGAAGKLREFARQQFQPTPTAPSAASASTTTN